MDNKRAKELLLACVEYINECVPSDAYDVLIDCVGFTVTELDTLVTGQTDPTDDNEDAFRDCVGVCCTYSFSPEATIYLFDSEEKAKKWLREALLEQYEIDTLENEWNATYEFSADGMYGALRDFFSDHTNLTEYHVAHISPSGSEVL